jgi:hypothetical protein
MARQCPRGHDGIEPEEVADDTSTKHQLTKPRHHHGQGLATREQAWGRHGRGPELRRWRGCEQPGSNRVDLADRRNRRRLIYRLSGISAAETDGACRNQARRWRGDTVARGVAREGRMRVSEGEETTGRTDRAAGRARPVGWFDGWAWLDRWARVGRESGEGRGF